MSSKAQITGMTGVYLVAAQLSSKGLIVSTTSRSAMGADILVTDQSCSKSYSIQVKTNAKPSPCWLLNKKAKETISKSHIYVFVNLKKTESLLSADYYIVPSKIVSDYMRTTKRPGSMWYAFDKEYAQKYKDKWSVIKVNKITHS